MPVQLVLSNGQFSHSRSWPRHLTRWYGKNILHSLDDECYIYLDTCSNCIYVTGRSNSSSSTLHENSYSGNWCISFIGKPFYLICYLHVLSPLFAPLPFMLYHLVCNQITCRIKSNSLVNLNSINNLLQFVCLE